MDGEQEDLECLILCFLRPNGSCRHEVWTLPNNNAATADKTRLKEGITLF